MRCDCIITADEYDLKGLKKEFPNSFHIENDRDSLYIPSPQGHTYIFYYGCIVFWNIEPEAEKLTLERIKPFEKKPCEIFREEYTYKSGSQNSVTNDIITLQSDHEDFLLQMLSVSYGLSQSNKLSVFEDRLLKTIRETQHIPQQLASKGRISLSSKNISKQIGSLIVDKHSINIHTDMLDAPKFLWDHSEFEKLYYITTNEHDLPSRLQVLNTRLDIIKDLFEVMSNELKHRHAIAIEWIIVILISIEVIISIKAHLF